MGNFIQSIKPKTKKFENSKILLKKKPDGKDYEMVFVDNNKIKTNGGISFISDDVFDLDKTGNKIIDGIRDENCSLYSEQEKFEPFKFDRIDIKNKKRSTIPSLSDDSDDVLILGGPRIQRRVSVIYLSNDDGVPSKFSAIRRYLTYSEDSENDELINDTLNFDIIDVKLPKLEQEEFGAD